MESKTRLTVNTDACMFLGEPNQFWFCLTLVGMATPTKVGSCGTVETLGDNAPL